MISNPLTSITMTYQEWRVIRKDLKARWKQYLADNPKYKRTIYRHHFFRTRYSSKWWLKEIEKLLNVEPL